MKRAKHFAKKSKLHKDPERYSGKRPGDDKNVKSRPADATIKVRKMLKKKGLMK